MAYPQTAFRRTCARVFRPILVAVGLLFPVATSQGEEAAYILRDGTRVAMTRSRTEWGVTLREGSDTRSCAARLASDGCGVLEDIAFAEDARVKILKVADTTAVRRSRVRLDADVAELRRVYRFAGLDLPMISSGEINVRVKPDLDDVERTQLWQDFELVEISGLEGVPQVYRVRPANPEHDEILRAQNMTADRRVVWAQPNLRRPPAKRQAVASDEFFGLQWHLNNSGQTGGRPDADIDAAEAWLIAEGQGVLIGMFDDACDVDHEDLRENYSGEGHDPTLESNDPGFDDPRPKQIGDQHGTAVMGLAVARANSVGGRGVAYLSRFAVSRGLGNMLTEFDIAGVFTFARQKGVDVHLNSWGLPGPNSSVIEDAVELAFREGRPVENQNPAEMMPGEEDDEPPPAKGMVIVWASGNEFTQLLPGFDYSMIPHVIGVGASTSDDRVAEYSNFGTNINVLAPGGADDADGLLTTDNEDMDGRVDNGYNVGGTELDTEGRYTGTFSGTSAACPVAAGVAALILSVNDELTANDVRLIMEHTADQIGGDDAAYNKVTSRSIRYGYGRINARRASEAAQQSLVNGGLTWPERPFTVRISAGRLRWQTSVGTNEFLVVEGDLPFEFIPADGSCYVANQLGCGSSNLAPLPSGVRITSVISCARGCEFAGNQSVESVQGVQKFYGIFARNLIGRYAFGVAVDSAGIVTDAGPEIGTVADTGTGSTGGSGPEGPRVTISASPLEGQSPLTVQFMGNAVSGRPIDERRTSWDFDISSPTTDSTTRNAIWTYLVAGNQSQTFTAQLTMYDVDGVPGAASVMIRVIGSADPDMGGSMESDLRIIVGLPGNADADVSAGTSPFSVELSADSRSVPGTLQSITWDLGDGSTARSLIVPHTYFNTTAMDLVIPITATITTRTTGGVVLSNSATRLITIRPGSGNTSTGNDNICFASPVICNGGAGAGGRGCIPGFLPLAGSFLTLFLFRRRIR